MYNIVAAHILSPTTTVAKTTRNTVSKTPKTPFLSKPPLVSFNKLPLLTPNKPFIMNFNKPFIPKAVVSQNNANNNNDNEKHYCFARGEDEYLYCEGVKVQDVMDSVEKTVKTAFYLYSKPQIARNVESYKDLLQGLNNSSIIGFPIKANKNINILKYLKELGCGVVVGDAVELKLALEAGYDLTKCRFTGKDNKSEDLVLAVKNGLFVDIDSDFNLKNIVSAAKNARNSVKVLLNITLDVGQEDPVVATENKKLQDFLHKVKAHPEEIKLVGVHCDLESIFTKVNIFDNEAADRMKKYIDQIRKQGFEICYLNIGGDLPIDMNRNSYNNPNLLTLRHVIDNTDWPEKAVYVENVDECVGVHKLVKSQGLNLIIEPGRTLIANTCGFVGYDIIDTSGSAGYGIIDRSCVEFFLPTQYVPLARALFVSPPPHDQGRVGSVIPDVGDRSKNMSSWMPPEYWVEEDGSFTEISPIDHGDTT